MIQVELTVNRISVTSTSALCTSKTEIDLLYNESDSQKQFIFN